MIKFRCHECGQVLQADESEIGKKVRCIECGEIVTIYGHCQNIKRPPIFTPSTPRPKPMGEQLEANAGIAVKSIMKMLFATLGVLVAALVLIAAYVFVTSLFRDNWERDNTEKINSMIAQANKYAQENQYAAALDTFGDLFSLVKSRQIKNKFLADSIKSAKSSFGTIKDAYAPRLRTELAEKLTRADAKALTDQKETAVELYNQIINTIIRYGYEEKLAELLAAAQENKATAQKTLEKKTPTPQEQIKPPVSTKKGPVFL